MNYVTINTGQLITLADGRFSCTMDEVYSAYNSILDDNLYTHALIRAGEFVEPRINHLFPWVKVVCKDYPVKGLDQSNDSYITTIKDWLEEVSQKYGNAHVVPVMADDWVSIDPLEELSDIVNRGKK